MHKCKFHNTHWSPMLSHFSASITIQYWCWIAKYSVVNLIDNNSLDSWKENTSWNGECQCWSLQSRCMPEHPLLNSAAVLQNAESPRKRKMTFVMLEYFIIALTTPLFSVINHPVIFLASFVRPCTKSMTYKHSIMYCLTHLGSAQDTGHLWKQTRLQIYNKNNSDALL